MRSSATVVDGWYPDSEPDNLDQRVRSSESRSHEDRALRTRTSLYVRVRSVTSGEAIVLVKVEDLQGGSQSSMNLRTEATQP